MSCEEEVRVRVVMVEGWTDENDDKVPRTNKVTYNSDSKHRDGGGAAGSSRGQECSEDFAVSSSRRAGFLCLVCRCLSVAMFGVE